MTCGEGCPYAPGARQPSKDGPNYVAGLSLRAGGTGSWGRLSARSVRAVPTRRGYGALADRCLNGIQGCPYAPGARS